MKRTFNIIFKLIISVLFYTLLSSIGAFDNRIKGVAFFIFYYVLLLVFSTKKNYKENVIILLAPIVLLEIPLRIATGLQDNLITITSSVLSVLLAVILFFLKKSINAKLVLGAFGLIIVLVFNIFFFKNWLNYCENGSFSGKINEAKQYDLKFTNYKFPYDTIYTKNEPKIIIADFWTESCAACFKKFPKFKELKDEYLLNSNIRFITTLNASRDNYIKYARSVDSTNTLNTYIVNDSITKQLEIFSYPTIIVFKEGNIIFKGSHEVLKEYLHSKEFKELLK